MMKLVTVFLMAIVVLGGCTSMIGGGGQSSTEQFRVGTSALSLGFVQGQPPSRVIVESGGDEVVVGLDVRNNGAEPLSGGILVFSGFDARLVNWPASAQIPSLEGKSSDAPIGGRDLVEVRGAVNAQAIGEVYRPNFLVTACYPYKTAAQIPVCIDLDPTSRTAKSCTPSSFSGSNGQGGPVGVSSVEQESSPGSTLFKIVIKNMGGGDVFEGAVSKCQGGTGAMTFRDLDKISVGSVTVGTQPLDCRGQTGKSISLTDGQAVIYCTLKGARGSAYASTLNVDISYNYRQTTSKTVEIVKLG